MPEHMLQSSFNGGEVSPRLFGRSDAAIYDIALAEMTNFAPTVEGPAIKRSGFLLAAPVDAAASTTIPFEFNSTQAYVLVFTDHAATVYDAAGALLTTIGGLPWSAAEARTLEWQQSADVLYLCHPNYPMAKISRTGPASFVYSVLTLSSGPFADENTDRSILVTSSGTAAGAVATLTATSAIFLPGHIGGMFQIQALDFSAYPMWEPGMQVSSGAIWRWEGRLYTAATSGYSGQTPPTHVMGTEFDGTATQDINSKTYGVKWTYLCDQYGQLQITATGSPTGASTTATATVLRALPPSLSSAASWRWHFGRFSIQNGWPKSVRIWNNRLVLFTDFEINGSVVGDYLNFAAFDDTGRLDADLAFRYRITGSNPINWAAVDLQLLISTDRAEWAIGPINSQVAASATNLQCVRQSHYGSAQVRPLQANEKTIFVQRGGHKVRESSFDLAQNRYMSPNLTVWCRHLTAGGLTRLAWQQEAEEIIWALRGDGQLLMHGYSPEQQVKGWARASLADAAGNATVLDICAVPGPGGYPDRLFALVERGATRTLEYLADWWVEGSDFKAGVFVDGALTYSGIPITHFGVGGTGFPAAWAGKAVAGLLDGKAESGLVIKPDGSVDLPYAASQVTIGFAYAARIVGLPAKLPSHAGGSSELMKKRLVSFMARVLDTAGIWAGQLGASRLAEVLRRPFETAMDTAAPTVSDVTDKITVEGVTDRAGQWIVESRAPLPAIIPLVRCTYTTEGKD